MKYWSIVLQLFAIDWTAAFFSNNNLPCNYLDSIDISNGVQQTNNSIIYSGIEYQTKHYGEINYILNDDMKSIIVKPYFRGCPCQIKSCIRLCCPHGSFVDVIKGQQQQRIKCRQHLRAKNVMAEILHENNMSKTLNLDQHFTYVNRICKSHFYADEFILTEVEQPTWQYHFINQFEMLFLLIFFQKGHILFENELVNHREYCLKVGNINDSIKVEAMICYDKPDEPHIRYSTLPYC